MKYIIAENKNGGLVAKVGGMYHSDMHTIEMGMLVGAGYCERNEDGTYRVWGESLGYGIKSKPEDAKLLKELLST
jgi:hypothetical protein